MRHVERDDLTPVILAGGSGTRLWPMSRRTFPKHLIALTGERTLLQQCAERVTRVAPAAHTLTIGAVDQGDLIAHQLGALDAAFNDGLILEPAARNTAAACAAAALYARARFGADQILWICAADHVMGDVDALLAAVAEAAEVATTGRLVTFGIEPSHPEPGFGYIKVGARLGGGAAHEVARFVEKPEREVARAMLEEGGHLWNSGMFVFRAGDFLAEFEAHAPDILSATRAAMGEATGRPLVPGASYGTIRSAPVDKAVMEVSERIAVVPCEPRWSDVGSWRAVWETLARDGAGNATRGDVLLEGAENCLVIGDGRLVAAVGVRDLAIIDTGDAVMIADRDDSNAVKNVVARLVAAERREAAAFAVAVFAWGERRERSRRDGVVVSDLIVGAGREATLAAAADENVHVFGGELTAPLVLAPGTTARLANGAARAQTFVEVRARSSRVAAS